MNGYNYFRRAFSTLLVLISFLLFTTSSNAKNISSYSVFNSTPTIQWKDKISHDVLSKMKLSDTIDKISVWIWFSDIDQKEIDRQVKLDTGLTINDISVEYKKVPEDLLQALKEVSDNSNDTTKKKVAKKITGYINSNNSERMIEQNRAITYIKSRRKIASKFYDKKNRKIIEDLHISNEDIRFKSRLTPSIVADLTKKEVEYVAKSKYVNSIDIYDDIYKEEEPLCESQKATMRVNEVREQFGLTGHGVNVLMNDHGCVRFDADNYDQISFPEKIKVVVNKNIYTTKNTDVMPGDNEDTHPNLIAAEMQSFSPDVNLYSVGYRRYKDVEWALLNCDIQLINGSINLGSGGAYSSDAPAKWFDALISTNNVTLVASAGNSEVWSPVGWPNVISPSNGYNNIAAGAYDTNGTPNNDKMFNFRYNPTDSTNQVCYKPDIVVAANSTSEASPALTGIISMLIELKPSLATKPELIKAIIMASCQRKVKPATGTEEQENIYNGLTQKQGAGAVDAYRAIGIVLQENYGIKEIASGFQETDFTQNDDGNNINVSIAWLRQNTNLSGGSDIYTTSVGSLQELSLSVYDNTEIKGISEHTNAGKQMVYFPSAKNNQYTIRVTKTSENTETVRYAYAWSTEETNGKRIIFHTQNTSGKISKEEVETKLLESGISSDSAFFAAFDDSVKSIGDNAFEGSSNLSYVDINRGITAIGKYAFSNCSLLKNIVIPDGLYTIDEGAFQNCTSLKNVIIGNSVRSIETYAFYRCFTLSRVIFNKYIAPTIRTNAFLDCANSPTGHIPLGAIGYADNYDSLQIIHKTSIRTLYFSNNKNWDDVNVYLWNSHASHYSKNYPMEYTYTNYLNEKVYSITLDFSEYDMIRFYGAGHRSVDFNVGNDGTGYYLTSEEDEDIWNISTFIPDVRTIYFTNTNNWTDVRAYLWKSGTTQDNLWHGAPMIYESTNSYGEDIYSITLDYKEYNSVIFNDYNSINQTVDINIGISGTGYYLTGYKTGNNWNVDSYTYE
ncbi:MAG: leucine-rich repeat protein [Ruminococcus sp.]|nr:leucine-rich repeat protein [Ruminococcus sp.]